MLDAPIGFAFSAGAVAAFNPCGFALLPAYLAMFLAGPDEREPSAGRARRAPLVAAAVAAGFVLVFGIGGFLISQTALTVQRYTPWLTVVIGLALIPVGLAMMRGWAPKIRLPAVRGVAGGTGPAAMFIFGVSYAIASLSCTIPAFLVAVVGTFSTEGSLAGLLVFAAYTAGMASVLVVLTVVVATARQGVLRRIRRVLPYVNVVAGALAVLAGAYVAYYGFYEIQIERGGSVPTGPIDAVTDASGAVTTWVTDLGSGWVLVGACAAVVLVVGASRSLRRPARRP